MKFLDKLKLIKNYWPISKFYFRHLLKKSKPLLALFFQITNKCNARCLMCFNWQRINKPSDELSLEEIEKFSRTLGSVPNLTIGGGEPFLREDLPDICKIFSRNNETKRISIPTNCLLPEKIFDLTRKILESCPSTKIAIVLSLDGLRDTHEYIRGVKGIFDKVLETYKKITELLGQYSNLKININTTVSDKNYKEIPEIIDFVDKNFKVGFHTVEVIRGCYNRKNVQMPPLEEYKKLTEDILRSKTIDGDKYHKLMYSYYHKIALETLEKERQLIPCRASSYVPVVDATGNVYNCELLPAIGNLREVNYDFLEIWNSKKAKDQRKNIADKKCYCTHFCYQIQNIPMSPYHFFKAIFGK